MLQSLDGAFYRRLAVTAAALAACRLGVHLPVPGLNPETVAALFKPGDPAVARLSIFALGIMPLLNALILAELLKIVAPSVRQWELAAPRNRERMRYVVIGLALLFAILQAGGVASALEGVSRLVAEPGTFFRVVCTATMVAGAALVIALAAVIDRAGLGSGLWLIFLAPTLAELPQNVWTIAQLYDAGQYPLAAIVRAALFTAFAIAGVVSLVLAARGAAEVSAACVWPLLIAYSVLAWLLIGLGLAISGGSIEQAVAITAPGNAIRHLALATVVILIAWLYVRSIRLAGLPSPVPAAPIAVVLAAIALAAEILQSQLQTALPLDSVQLVVATVVATTILTDWGFISRSERPVEDSSSEPLSPQA
jgi:preprotein translocase subunit SecY